MYEPQFYNPYSFQYQQPRSQLQLARFVSSKQEAESCMLPLGTSAILMDENEDKFYFKKMDMNGISSMSTFTFRREEQEQSQQIPIQDDRYITREEFDRWRNEYESAVQSSQSSTEPNEESTPGVRKRKQPNAANGAK